jgi:hypothetical protein
MRWVGNVAQGRRVFRRAQGDEADAELLRAGDLAVHGDRLAGVGHGGGDLRADVRHLLQPRRGGRQHGGRGTEALQQGGRQPGADARNQVQRQPVAQVRRQGRGHVHPGVIPQEFSRTEITPCPARSPGARPGSTQCKEIFRHFS